MDTVAATVDRALAVAITALIMVRKSIVAVGTKVGTAVGVEVGTAFVTTTGTNCGTVSGNVSGKATTDVPATVM